MTIWEEHEITLEEYARAFNKALDEAWEACLKDKVYLLQLNDERVIKRVAMIKNIRPPDVGNN